MKRLVYCFILTSIISVQSTLSQTIKIEYRKGGSENVVYKGSTATGKGIKMDNGELVRFTELSLISTDNFDAFDKIFRKSDNRYPHLKVEFTGDKNAYSLQLEKLRKRRTGADVTRAAGGVMTILGVLSGDRGLTAAGLATGAAGQIAREVNNDKTSNTQSAMLNDLDHRSKESAEQKAEEPEKTEEQMLRDEYGNENVDGYIELLDNNHEKALAYANVGELSKDANHRLVAMWLKALIVADQDKDAEEVYKKLVTFDPEIADINEAKKEINLLLEEVEELRREQ